MGEESRQLEKRIDRARSALRRDIDIVENKVRDTFDWRRQFQERPGTMIGVAFGVGALLSLLMAPRSSKPNTRQQMRVPR